MPATYLPDNLTLKNVKREESPAAHLKQCRSEELNFGNILQWCPEMFIAMYLNNSIHLFKMAWQYGNYLLQIAKQKPSKLLKQTKPDPKWRSLYQKLTELYLTGFSTATNNKIFFPGSHLLEKLIAKEKLNCLVVNLYPGNEGYSIMVKTRTGNDTETVHLPYEEGELLHYIDNEELPPLLVDLLERSQVNIFYNGCVIVEIRDYRRCSDSSNYDCYHVLLKSTTQSIVCDVGLLTNDSQRWTWEERHALESSLLLSTSEPLCLEPNVSVAVVANHLHHYKQLFSRGPIKRLAKKHSQVTVNKKRKFEQFAAPPSLKLYDFLIQKKKIKKRSLLDIKSPNLNYNFMNDVDLVAPDLSMMKSYFKPIKRPEFSTDNTPVTVEEYIMEIERTPGKVNYTQVTILQNQADEQYSGRLCLGRESQSSGTSCSYPLGSRIRVDKYVDQFTEIFTEEGRKSVKTTHLVPGQQPKVIFTASAKELMENNLSSVPTATASYTASTTNALNVTSVTASTSFPTSHLTSPTGMADIQRETEISTKNISSIVTTTATGSLSSGFTQTDASISLPPSSPVKFQLKARTPSPVPTTAVSSSFQTASSPTNSDVIIKDSGGFKHNDFVGSSGNISASMNISTVGLTQNLGLHNLVSLTGMSVSQALTVPISLAMVNSGQSTFLTSSAGIMVGSVSGISGAASSSPTGDSPIHSTATLQLNPVLSAENPPMSASPTTTVSSTPVTSMTSSALILPTGVMTSPPSVLSNTTSGMLSLPLNMAGGLGNQSVTAQLVASSLKGSTQGLRSSTPVSLIQMANSQQSAVPLISAVQHSLSQPARGAPSAAQNPPVFASASGASPTVGTPPPSVSPGVSVATPLVALLSQQQPQELQLALQKQTQQHGRQSQTSMQSRPKKKKIFSSSNK